MTESIQPGPAGSSTASPLPPAPETSAKLSTRTFWLLFFVIVILGTVIRFWDSASWRLTGYDELLYRRYLTLMDGGRQEFHVFLNRGGERAFGTVVNHRGIGALPEISTLYINTHALDGTQCELPPTRFTFIYSAWLWKEIRFGSKPPLTWDELKADAKKIRDDDYSQDATRLDPHLHALNDVTFFFGILTMVVAGLAASRMAGRAVGLGVLLLIACDPILIHMSEHAMIDGVFAFWSLVCFWTTWENLRQPNHRGWLLAHFLALAMMVLTKENAFFVYVALGVAVLANRWLHFGKVTGKFIAASIGGGALGAVLLIAIFGGLDNVLGVFRAFVTQAQTLEQVLLIGDGPWYRYLIDLLIVSPLVVCLALGALFTLSGTRKELGYGFVFIGVSYALMCNLPHGMNLRFATIWNFPLRLAAVLMIFELTRRWPRYSVAGAVAMVMLVGACEFRQYTVLATSPDQRLMFYELDTKSLLRPLKILKDERDLVAEDREMQRR